MPAFSPGLLAGNPPPRWGAPGDDRATRRTAGGKRGPPGHGTAVSRWSSGPKEHARRCRSPRSAASHCAPRRPRRPRRVTTCAPYRRRPRTARRAPAHGVGEPGRADPAPHGRGLRQLRPRREHPGAGVGQGGGRRRPAHLLLGPPRQRLRLARSPRAGTRRPAPRSARSSAPARDDLVVFTRNTTDSLNLLGRSLPRDTTTFVFETEHHAALLPWNPRRTVRLPVPGSVARRAGAARATRSRPPPPARGWSSSPAPRTSPASCGRSTRSSDLARHARRPGGPGRRAARPARRRRHRRPRRRLRRLLRPQALRPVRRRRARRPGATGSTARRRTCAAVAPPRR